MKKFICHRYRHTSTCRSLDTGIQRTADGTFLRSNESGTEMDEPHCRMDIHCNRLILLLDNVPIKYY